VTAERLHETREVLAKLTKEDDIKAMGVALLQAVERTSGSAR